MWIVGRGAVVAAVLMSLAVGRPASADNNPNGTAFRAVGWFKGKGNITSDSIQCEVPTIANAIADGAFAAGLWNTYGVQTLYFPDINNPFTNPCGGWIQLQNNLLAQAIQLERIDLTYRIPGARRFRQFVPARNGFPVACRQFRRANVFAGAIMNPIGSGQNLSGSGSPNVSFVQILPMISTQLIHCLRDQYAPLSTSLFASLPIVIRATAVGRSDAGDVYRSNTIPYTLELRHTCGNGRIDDGEQCDPNGPQVCVGFCARQPTDPSGTCSNDQRRLCRADADCRGVCMTPNTPTECLCVYGG